MAADNNEAEHAVPSELGTLTEEQKTNLERVGRITQLGCCKTSSKGWITRYINDLNGLMQINGNRRKMAAFKEKLVAKHKIQKQLAKKLCDLSYEEDTYWLEEEEYRIDMCLFELEEHLEAQTDKPESSIDSVSHESKEKVDSWDTNPRYLVTE